MKSYLIAGTNCEYDECESIEEARELLEEQFLEDNEYHIDTQDCKIYKLVETVELEKFTKDGKDYYRHKFVSKTGWTTVKPDFPCLFVGKMKDMYFLCKIKKYYNCDTLYVESCHYQTKYGLDRLSVDEYFIIERYD